MVGDGPALDTASSEEVGELRGNCAGFEVEAISGVEGMEVVL